jgi:hypothetical protein
MRLKPQRQSKLILAASAVIETLEQRQLLSASLFNTSSAPVGPCAPVAIAAGWVLGGDNVDLVTANGSSNSVSILPGNGDGTFQPAETFGVGSDPVAVAIGQFGGSAYYSIVTANKGDNTVSVLTDNGNGDFILTQTLTTGDGPDAVAIGDFCNNGYNDIAVANSGDNTVSIFLGKRGGGFSPAKTYSVGGDPDAIAVGDLGNVEIDIVTANAAGGTVSVLLGNGDGTFAPAETYAVGNDPTSVALGDFNAYGLTDIVTANAGDNTISILHNNGQVGFGPAQTYSVGNDPVSVVVGDFTGDGLDDVVTANAADDTVSILLGQPGGGLGAAQTYSTGHTPVGLAVADVNGDGYADIVAVNSGDGTVTVLSTVPPPYYSGIYSWHGGTGYSGTGSTGYYSGSSGSAYSGNSGTGYSGDGGSTAPTPTVVSVFNTAGQSSQSNPQPAAVNFQTQYPRATTSATSNSAPIAGDLSLLGSQIDPFNSPAATAEDSLQTNLPANDQPLTWTSPDNLALFSPVDYAGADSPTEAVAVVGGTKAVTEAPAKDAAANPVVVAANSTTPALAITAGKVDAVKVISVAPVAKNPGVSPAPMTAAVLNIPDSRRHIGAKLALCSVAFMAAGPRRRFTRCTPRR